MGAAVGDYDNDGDLDLFVTAFGPDTLYRNNGDGTFTDVTAAAGVSDPLWSTSAAFFDYDRDGDLDLFVANYLDFTVAGNKPCNDSARRARLLRPARVSAGARPAVSQRGQRPFHRRDRSVPASARPTAPASASSTGDYNGDGWLDLYVANDATPNQLWINQRDGTFVDEGLLSGAALNAAGNPEGSMGIASGDFDADGDEDLFVTNIVGETFALYINDGRGSFDDARGRVGLSAPTAAVHRLRHRLVRLRQRRLARSLRRQRRRQHHRGAARRAVPVPDAEPAVSQHRRAAGSRKPASAAARRFDARGDRPRRRLRRRRQRRRHRHRRHEQQRAGAAAAQSGRPQGNHWLQVRVAAGCRATASRSAPASASSAPDGRRCGGASGPTAAICRRATRASTSGSERRRRSMRSSCSFLMDAFSDGTISPPAGSSRCGASPLSSFSRDTHLNGTGARLCFSSTGYCPGPQGDSKVPPRTPIPAACAARW